MRYLTLLFLCVCTLHADAKNGYYIQPYFGLGVTNSDNIFMSGTSTSGLKRVSNKSYSLAGYNAGVGVGYRINKWRIVSGLSFMRSGHEIYYLDVFPSGFSSARYERRERESYYHIAVPLCVGYRIRAGNGISIVPQAGLVYTYTTSMKNRGDASGYKSRMIKGEEFDNSFNRSNLWYKGQVDVEIKTGKNTALVLGPSVHYMCNNVYDKKPAETFYHYPTDFPSILSSKNLVALFNIGVKINLHGQAAKSDQKKKG